MNIAPIIMPVPVGSVRVRKCIIEAGERYCEEPDMNLSNQSLGWIILGSVVYIGVFSFLLHKQLENDWPGWMIGAWLALPPLILGIYLILG